MEHLILTGFAAFCLYNCGNPANRLGQGFTIGKPVFWALRTLVNLANKNREMDFYCGKDLFSWALIESLNYGSHQRATLPESFTWSVLGSGRWHANDSGGHYQLLRQAILSWKELDTKSQERWELIAYNTRHPLSDWAEELMTQMADRAERKLWLNPDWQSANGQIKQKGGRIMIGGCHFEIGKEFSAQTLADAGFSGRSIQDILTTPSEWQSEWQGPQFEITRPCPLTEGRVYKADCELCSVAASDCPWDDDVKKFDMGPFVFLWEK